MIFVIMLMLIFSIISWQSLHIFNKIDPKRNVLTCLTHSAVLAAVICGTDQAGSVSVPGCCGACYPHRGLLSFSTLKMLKHFI